MLLPIQIIDRGRSGVVGADIQRLHTHGAGEKGDFEVL
jgi:hypothetical protein